MTGDAPAITAFGGGHGLAASLAALRRITPRLTAVVTVGDDGGSSGRLRAELGALPMGDLRMALAALAGADGWSRTWADLFQHRFGGEGALAGHAVGNLVLTALAERAGSPVAALDLAASLLGVAGRVLPLSCDGIDIVADVTGLDDAAPGVPVEVRGQAAVATTPGRVAGVRLVPAAPAACGAALAAAEAADWIVLGPGSLYTSVLPHLLVPDMRAAISGSRARRVMVLNLVAQPGETAGYTPEAHLYALATHAPGLRLDVVVADPAAVGDPEPLAAAAAELGARVHLAPVRAAGEPALHDSELLAAAFDAVFAHNGRSYTGRPETAQPGPSRLGPSQPGTPQPGTGRPESGWAAVPTPPLPADGRPWPDRQPGAACADPSGVGCSTSGGHGHRIPSGECKE
ncbi:cofD-related protein [Frankia sp. EI5c]|uniref:gluconeogenesis factor YvcK family protein n=1 Tax=Frankia sp. EI5c TaxID=683316 RepID=UPI0007C23A88|nr:uridine diphosphate-N-acetylglucosamine-binding protein YvcK [Frankia sp. EI5c]OAA28099.1 cofD-related protein [Frankia sp. EI5c]